MNYLTQLNFDILLARPESMISLALGRVILDQGFNLMGRVSSLDALLAEINIALPNVLIIDASLVSAAAPCKATLQLLRKIPRVIVCLASDQTDYLPVLGGGFDAYLSDCDPLEELNDCLWSSGSGGVYYGSFFKELIKQHGVTRLLADQRSAA